VKAALLTVAAIGSAFSLTACATTPRLYSEAELSSVGRACGVSAGEVVQEAEEPRVVILYRIGPSPAQRACMARWTHKRHLHLAVIDAVNFTDK
jgi:hypothetical protein